MTPTPGTEYWIGKTGVFRKVVANDGVIVSYKVGAHTYETHIADFRKMVAKSVVKFAEVGP